MSEPNRIVLVDETGRIYDRTGVDVELSEQDDGLTLKVFVKPLAAEGSSRAAADHVAALGQIMEQDQSVFRSGGQLKQFGPRPRITTARPRSSGTMAERLRGSADLLEKEIGKARRRGRVFTAEEERQHNERVADLRRAAEESCLRGNE